MCTPRGPITPSRLCPSAKPREASACAPPSWAIRNNTPRATCWRGSAPFRMTERAAAPGPGWARWRAPIGYPIAALCLWLVRPTFRSVLIGSAVALFGLLIRAIAAGHLRKREALAQTGPYARTRNPLYFGSALIAVGFALAGRSWLVAALLGIYFYVFY